MRVSIFICKVFILVSTLMYDGIVDTNMESIKWLVACVWMEEFVNEVVRFDFVWSQRVILLK